MKGKPNKRRIILFTLLGLILSCWVLTRFIPLSTLVPANGSSSATLSQGTSSAAVDADGSLADASNTPAAASSSPADASASSTTPASVSQKYDDPMLRDPNLPTQPPRSLVAIAQSTRKTTAELNEDDILALVRSAIEQAGGLEDIIRDGMTVVLKPNLVTMNDYTLPGWQGKPLSPLANGTTTDYRFTKAVVRCVRELNPNGKVLIMEGSSQPTKAVMKALKYTKEFIPGVDEFLAIEEDSGAWQDFKSDGLVKVLLPQGILHQEYYLNRKYFDADVLISLPCLKNHWSAAVTGAIKNTGIGASPANIYGISAKEVGRNNMVAHDAPEGDLHKWIHDFYLCRKHDFVIMDGLQGIQNGPTPCFEISGTTDIAQDQMNMRMVLAGRDAVAVDTIESLIMNWDPQSVGYLELLGASKAGNTDVSRIVVAGKRVSEVRKDFEGTTPAAGGKKIASAKAPGLSIKTLALTDGKLSLNLDTVPETVKVEVYADGKLCEPIITSSFDKCSVQLPGKTAVSIEIIAYDRFLNQTAVKRAF